MKLFSDRRQGRLSRLFVISFASTLIASVLYLTPAYATGSVKIVDAVTDEVIREIEASKTYRAPVVTEVKPLANYSAAEAYHQDYFLNNPNKGYCAFVVGPKVEKFQKTFAAKVKKD